MAKWRKESVFQPEEELAGFHGVLLATREEVATFAGGEEV